jgi:hypothetical protein
MSALDDAEKRECLKEELTDAISYLYYSGKKLGKKIDDAK